MIKKNVNEVIELKQYLNKNWGFCTYTIIYIINSNARSVFISSP